MFKSPTQAGTVMPGSDVAETPAKLRRDVVPERLHRLRPRTPGADPWATDSPGGYSDEPPF